MAAKQGKPNKGGLQGLFSLYFGPVIGKTNSAMQQGFILFPFYLVTHSPLVKPQGPAGPGRLEEKADCAQQIASHFCNASVLRAGEEALPAAQVTPPQVSATQMLHSAKNCFSQFCQLQITAPHSSLR